MRTPKQLLNITGDTTMLSQTVDRLLPVFGARNFWVVTHTEQAVAVRKELQNVPASHVLTEPVGRNTAAAIGLAAIHLIREYDDAVMAVLPSDSYVADPARYRGLVSVAVSLAKRPGNLVVLGIQPTRPEIGYGYIERGKLAVRAFNTRGFTVRRFTEKPELSVAEKYVASGRYLWNAGMFFWRASTFMESLKLFLPVTHEALCQLAETIGTRRYNSTLERIYPKLESISVDYAVMEPTTREKSGAFRVLVIPAKVGWSDIGSWAAVHELLAAAPEANVSAGPFLALDAQGNYFSSPNKFVAAIGVRNLIFVETDDAVLLCPRNRSQDVGKIVKWLEEQKVKNLL